MWSGPFARCRYYQSVAVSFSLDVDQLVIAEPSGRIVWKGYPDAASVVDVVSLPEGAAAVLLDSRAAKSRMKPFRNLIRVAPDGSIIWRAEPPHHDDLFVAVRWREGRLSANTWGGWSVTV